MNTLKEICASSWTITKNHVSFCIVIIFPVQAVRTKAQVLDYVPFVDFHADMSVDMWG